MLFYAKFCYRLNFWETIMNISLTPELERFVQEKVACGMYTSASEVIRESLRLMHTYNGFIGTTSKTPLKKFNVCIGLLIDQFCNMRQCAIYRNNFMILLNKYLYPKHPRHR